MKSIIIISLFFMSASPLAAQHPLIKQGHRGSRGLMPENTIAAMKRAIDIGVDVLEVDVVISKDKQVVVSHDAYMASAFCLKPSGDTIAANEEKTILLYAMNYEEIKKYDAGFKPHPQFPQQQHFKTYKPLLGELIDSADAYAKQTGKSLPAYNIEIKSQAATDKLQQPEPKEFVRLVMNVCEQKNIIDRMNIQSFDVRPLQVIHAQYPRVVLAYLTANQKTIRQNLDDLGFTPPLYSPYYKTVSKETVDFCHNNGMKIIPWTVNTKEEIAALVAMGVDGIITDYPNYFY